MAKPKIGITFNAVDKVSSNVDKMNRKVNGFSRNAQKSFKGVGDSMGKFANMVRVAAVGLATGKIAQMVTEYAKAGDEIAKTSRQIGLSAVSLQELTFAADRQGVSAEDLKKSFEALNNRVGQLRTNQGSLYTQLNKSNPKLMQQLKTVKDSEQAFNILMDAIKEQKTAADRAALAQAAFGRSGQKLIRMAEIGTKGIGDLRKESQKYGGIITDKAAAGSEKFVDAMTNMKAALTGLKNQALGPLIQQLTPLIQKFADWVAKNRELIGLRIKQFFQGIVSVVKTLVKLWEGGLLPLILKVTAAWWAATKAIAAYKAVMLTLGKFGIGSAAAQAAAAGAGGAAAGAGGAAAGGGAAAAGGGLAGLAASTLPIYAAAGASILAFSEMRSRSMKTTGIDPGANRADIRSIADVQKLQQQVAQQRALSSTPVGQGSRLLELQRQRQQLQSQFRGLRSADGAQIYQQILEVNKQIADIKQNPQKADITVDFKNMPAGTQASATGNANITLNTGYATATP